MTNDELLDEREALKIATACSDLLSFACIRAGWDVDETVSFVTAVLEEGDAGPAALLRAVGERLIELSHEIDGD